MKDMNMYVYVDLNQCINFFPMYLCMYMLKNCVNTYVSV